MVALRHRVLLQAVQEPLPNRRQQPSATKKNEEFGTKKNEEFGTETAKSEVICIPHPGATAQRDPRRVVLGGRRLHDTRKRFSQQAGSQRTKPPLKGEIRALPGQALTTEAASARRATTARRSRGALGFGSIPGLDLANPSPGNALRFGRAARQDGRILPRIARRSSCFFRFKTPWEGGFDERQIWSTAEGGRKGTKEVSPFLLERFLVFSRADC
jgi:hypothetical protein